MVIAAQRMACWHIFVIWECAAAQTQKLDGTHVLDNVTRLIQATG